MINAFWEPVRFHIQESKERDWTRLVDTSRQDIAEEPVHSAQLSSRAAFGSRAGSQELNSRKGAAPNTVIAERRR